jgi:predicted HD phosphohydrolase
MTDLEASATAQFHAMTEGTKADWDIIATEAMFAAQRLPDRVMDHLRLLDGAFGGFAVDRLTHSLQTATRAERAGRDDQYVLCAPYGTEPEEPAVCGGASLRGCFCGP